ncbi:N-terminal nucleophile aminohydrolase, partial [Coniophora puteana RWD-64-598 SS2]
MAQHHGQVYLAVHGGAGYHSRESEAQVKRALKRACTETLKSIDVSMCSALDLVERAVTILEDEDCLNAGLGSNLTESGTVECDASIMDGSTGDFGSVGAVSGVKNPIRAARAVLEHSREPDPLGRIRPMTLVGAGAHTFAHSSGIEIVPPESLISSRAKADWTKWTMRLERSKAGGPAVDDSESLPEEAMQDTVGAVVLDARGNMAACVSSGGLLLKYSGRVGEAAIFGAGCWAQQSSAGGMACSVSGGGEHIARCSLARALGEALHDPCDAHEVLQDVLTRKFSRPLQARGERDPQAGMLLLTKEASESGDTRARLWCGFTTKTMAVGYATWPGSSPRIKVLRRETTSAGDDESHLYITS